MGKDNVLGIDDLLADETAGESEEATEELYDLVIPPGLSMTLIQELIFEMKLIVLRGDRETVERANKYLWDVIDDRIEYFGD